MSRITIMLKNRYKFLMFAPLVIAAMALLLMGIDVTSAAANSSEAKQKNSQADKPKNTHDLHKIRDPKVDSTLSPKQRARMQRDAAIKKRQDSKKFVQDVAEGKQPASSNQTEGGGAK
jgi:hypothetical protein